MNFELNLMATITCALVVGGLEIPARAAERLPRKTVVFIAAENEYHAWQTLPEFGQMLEDKYGFKCEYLTSSTDDKDTNRFFIPRLEKVRDADLVVLFARRRALPLEQLNILKDYLDRGKPMIGIRTASHAFDGNLMVPKEGGSPVAADARLPAGLEQWKTFDREVLGCQYHGHYEPGIVTVVTVNPEKRTHPILTGVPGQFDSPSWLYEIDPLSPGAEPLMMGKIPGQEPQAVLLINTFKRSSRIVYTSLGHWEDFKLPAFRRILVNSVFWTMKLDVPQN